MRCGGYPLCAHSASPRSARAKICHSGAPRISVAAGTDKGLDELFLIFRKHHISGRHFAPSSARAGAGDWRHGVRRRAAHRGQRKCPDRERDAGGGRHEDSTGRQGRRRSRARGCHAREPGRQDCHADACRHTRPSRSDTRSAHAGSETSQTISAQVSLGSQLQ